MKPCVWCETAPCRCQEIERTMAALEALFMWGVAERAERFGESVKKWRKMGDKAAKRAIRLNGGKP